MIPRFEKFLYPVLFLLKDGAPLEREKLRIACIQFMGFTDEELKERVNKGTKSKLVDRIQWATFYLIKAGLIRRPKYATEQITEEGKRLLETNINTIDRLFLRKNYPAFRKFEEEARKNSAKRAKAKKTSSQVINNLNEEAATTNLTITQSTLIQNNATNMEYINKTQEQIAAIDINHLQKKISTEGELLAINETINKITQGVLDELKETINDFDNLTFKRLLLELMPKMGYSSVFEDCPIQASIVHDIALAGFMNIDEMGLNRFFILAHTKTKDEINLIDVQSYIGALSSMGVNLGVYITTSSFTKEAYEYNNFGSVRCILIDGNELAKLMMKFNIGVITKKVFEIKDIDQEFLFTRLTDAL